MPGPISIRTRRSPQRARSTRPAGAGRSPACRSASRTSSTPSTCRPNGARRSTSGRRPERDAACVALSRKAGGVLLGKTVTTEFANLHPGPTRNPHDLTRTPAGSSSGSAAAVADFMVPIAIGTQTTGSTIRPASFCGVFGYRPTYGEHRMHGVMEASGSLDTLGILARSVEDIALYRDVLLGIPPEPIARLATAAAHRALPHPCLGPGRAHDAHAHRRCGANACARRGRRSRCFAARRLRAAERRASDDFELRVRPHLHLRNREPLGRDQRHPARRPAERRHRRQLRALHRGKDRSPTNAGEKWMRCWTMWMCC